MIYINIIIYTLKVLLVCLYMSYTNSKIINKSNTKLGTKEIGIIVYYTISSIIYTYINLGLNIEIENAIFALICVGILYMVLYRLKFMYAMLITVLSLAINYSILFVATMILYFPAMIFNVNNEMFNFLIINVLMLLKLLQNRYNIKTR